MTADHEARITELESRVAFQEDTLNTLSQQLAHQQSVTEKQQQQLQNLYRQLQDLRDLSGHEGPSQEMQEKPPHY